MFHHTPRNASVLLITDTRTLADANYDAKQKPEPGAQAVLRYWWPGVEVWGKGGWDGVARVALFEFGAKVDKQARNDAKRTLKAHLSALKGQIKTIIVLQSRSKSARKVYTDDYAEASHTGTVAWDFFDPPAPLADMAGTFWETPYGTILPLQNPQNVDYVYGAMTVRWLTAVRHMSLPSTHPQHMSIFRPSVDTTFTHPNQDYGKGLCELLESARAGTPIAVDIESFSTDDLITVIGLSDGKYTCAVPWEPFQPHGQSYIEPGLHLAPEGNLVRRILATAKTVVLHNGVKFDIPYLARKGVPVTGWVWDTYLAHGDLYGQFRHGLQAAVAYEFVIPPWKSFHRADAAKNGLDPEDAEAWIQDPQELRTYCAQDVFYSWWLGQALAKHGGIAL